MKALGTLGVALVLVAACAARSAAYYWDDLAPTPVHQGDQVVRSSPLDLTLPPSDSLAGPFDGFLAHFEDQERKRLRALRDEYPTSDPWSGTYNPDAMRDWQRSVIRQQGSAVLGAIGDTALARCELFPICDSPAARAAAILAGSIVNGLHWHMPLGPVRASIDTPPGLKEKISHVRVSLEYRRLF